MSDIPVSSRPSGSTPIAFIGALVRNHRPAPAPIVAAPPIQFKLVEAVEAVEDIAATSPAPPRDLLSVREAADRPTAFGAALAGHTRRGDTIHLSPGALIPGTRYRLLRWLGEGGMGVVYEAVHLDIDRRVAIKVLRAEMCEEPRALQLFRDEARAAGRIGSAHIVEIHDFAELPDGRLLYAMELLGGRALSRALAERPLPASRVIAILRQLCKGLASAHTAHIVHRDIKPDNIFLDERLSRRDVVKILDFGISVFMVGATATDTCIVGTPLYLAPEIITSRPFDARVDMYAVGCTAYEMLTGHPPYAGTIKELLYAHVYAPLPSLSILVHDHGVPAALAAVILRCLAKAPEHRYVDMKDLEAALCEAQIAAGIETDWDDLALPDVDGERRDLLLRGMPDPAVARPRRRRLHVAAAALGVALLGGGALLGGALSTDTVVAADPALAHLEAVARAAAARVAFVYPPVDDPQSTTSYQVVRALEAMRGAQARPARELARTLRREFAGTLGAIGDRLWARPGGLEFAVDAYAQALLFDRDLEPAALRADLTPGQLARLAVKAASRDFSETELIAVEPLVVLADAELVGDSPALLAVRESIARRTTTRDADLARAARSASGDEAPPPVAASPARDEPRALSGPRGPARVDPSAARPRKEPHRDPAAAAAATQQARLAIRASRVAEAERLYEKALGHDHRSVAAHVGLTELYFNRGEYARALGFGEVALKLAPGDAALHLLVGDAAFKVFRLDDARQRYQRASQLGHAEAELRLEKLALRLDP